MWIYLQYVPSGTWIFFFILLQIVIQSSRQDALPSWSIHSSVPSFLIPHLVQKIGVHLHEIVNNQNTSSVSALLLYCALAHILYWVKSFFFFPPFNLSLFKLRSIILTCVRMIIWINIYKVSEIVSDIHVTGNSWNKTEKKYYT